MRKSISILFFLLASICAGSLYAQKAKLSKEEFRDRQQEFIIQRAGLTPEEAKQFFPLYFELQDKKESYNREAWKKIRQGKDPNTSEAEYSRIVEDVIRSRITNDNLDLEYVKKYKKFLSAKKIYDIQRAEMRFHRELLKSVRHGKKAGNGTKK